jgi:hypothetical protein
MIAPDNNNWVIGSVEGVNKAAIITAINKTYFHIFNILELETKPNIPTIN